MFSIELSKSAIAAFPEAEREGRKRADNAQPQGREVS